LGDRPGQADAEGERERERERRVLGSIV